MSPLQMFNSAETTAAWLMLSEWLADVLRVTGFILVGLAAFGLIIELCGIFQLCRQLHRIHSDQTPNKISQRTDDTAAEQAALPAISHIVSARSFHSPTITERDSP